MINRRPLLAAALLATPSIARAQGEWPVRPVRIIVPWPPGGSTDVLVRIYAELMQPILGQNFIIENRPGAGGNIGIDATAKATPDGYTMGIASVGHLVINNFLYARLPYDPARDLMPVGIAWDLPNVVVVSSQHNPSRNLADFKAWVRAKRGGFTYGSPGVGTTGHLTGALFAGRVQVEGTHVPFRGAAQIIPAMLSGDLDSALDNLASYVPVIQEGRMRALAVTSAARWRSPPPRVGPPCRMCPPWRRPVCRISSFPPGKVLSSPPAHRASPLNASMARCAALSPIPRLRTASCVWGPRLYGPLRKT